MGRRAKTECQECFTFNTSYPPDLVTSCYLHVYWDGHKTTHFLKNTKVGYLLFYLRGNKYQEETVKQIIQVFINTIMSGQN